MELTGAVSGTIGQEGKNKHIQNYIELTNTYRPPAKPDHPPGQPPEHARVSPLQLYHAVLLRSKHLPILQPLAQPGKNRDPTGVKLSPNLG